ncbi:type II toxin-antitoxin system RelE/ParE family toxin [Algoriphagus sp. Y33]|uniref:type II toxin-antitoxin system RelE/ParE family toxin n=1 Tax=Algoriphagus sp. Y33 TaxID=2772483 RepID=UPI0017867E35|nr:type II toxin-antitoxin system RelE/ParE family toxin [Algoriphagus sp. Y33]
MRTIEVYRDYFWDFYNDQSKSVKDKIDYVLSIVMNVQYIPQKFFKHIEDGVYEIRVKVGSDIYRVSCFFDDGKLVILLNGFQKKSQKTPKVEIERAIRLRKEYYDEKES